MEPDLIKTSNPVFKKAISAPSPWENFLSIFKTSRGVNPSATQTLNEVVHSQKIDKQELIKKLDDKKEIKKSIEKKVDIIISIEDTNLLIKFLKSGYTLNRQHAEKIIFEKQQIWAIQPDLNAKNEIVKLLTLNTNLIEDIFLNSQQQFIENINNFVTSKLNEQYPSLSREHAEKHEARFLSHLDSQNRILTNFPGIFSENIGNIHQAIDVFQDTSLIFVKERNWNTHVFDKLNDRNSLIIKQLKKKYVQHNSHIEQKLQQSEMLYLAQSIDNDFNARVNYPALKDEASSSFL